MADQVRIRRRYTIPNWRGLHGRTAMQIVKLAANWWAIHRIVSATLFCKGQVLDCRSIVSIMELGATKGQEVEIEVVGRDAVEFMQNIDDMFARRFDEDEHEHG